MNKIEKLGLDFGDVIVDSSGGDGIKFQLKDNYLEKLPISESFESIVKLRQRFGQEIYIVSRIDEGFEPKVRNWLNHYDFFNKTGFKPEQVHFVLKRPEKSAICQDLGITHFVDDRLEVLGQLGTVQHKYLFNKYPKLEEDKDFKHHINNVTVVKSWPDLVKELLAD